MMRYVILMRRHLLPGLTSAAKKSCPVGELLRWSQVTTVSAAARKGSSSTNKKLSLGEDLPTGFRVKRGTFR